MSISPPPTNTAELQADWSRPIGQVMLAFGNIELSILRCITGVPMLDPVDDMIQKYQFARRAKSVKRALSASTLDPVRVQKVVDLISESLVKAHGRNLIAHNPLQLSVYLDDQRNIQFKPEIRSLRELAHVMTYFELEVLARDVEILSNKLYNAVDDLLKSK